MAGLRGRPGSALVGSLPPLSWVLVHTWVVCALQSLSPQPVEFCNQIPLTFTVRSPGGSQSLAGSLRWDILLSAQTLHCCRGCSSIIVLSSGCPPESGSMAGAVSGLLKRTLEMVTDREMLACCSPRGCKGSQRGFSGWCSNRTEFPAEVGGW